MDPLTQQFTSLLAEGAQLGQAKDFERAAAVFVQAASLRPDDAEAHFNVGVAYRGMNRLADALAAFERAVALRPDWPEAQFNLGNGYREARRVDEAIRVFEKAVELRPNYLKALNNLGNLWCEQGDFDRSENILQRAVAVKTDYAEGLFSLGKVLRHKKRTKEALDLILKASILQPKNGRYKLKLADVQKQLGQHQAAHKTLNELLTVEPENVDAVVQMATLLREQKKDDEALAVIDASVARGQRSATILWLRADIRRTQKHFDAALEDLKLAVQLDPLSVQVHNLTGVVHAALGDIEEAIAAYQRAIDIRPDMVEVHNNLGAAFQALERFRESEAALDIALRLKPDFAIARLNRALSLLRDGQMQEGWREFEWRFLCQEYRIQPTKRPTWVGEDLHGKTILLRAEQGLGDTFQFIRYARLLKDRGARVVFECQEPACHFVSRFASVDVVIKRGEKLPQADVQLPLMSLPVVLGTELDSIPNSVPYLFPEATAVEQWRKRLGTTNKLRIGIAWQGNKKFAADHLRSLPLSSFRPLAELENVELISLQKNEGVEQIDDTLGFAVRHFGDELDAKVPFQDTAAIMAICDLIVTSDTAVAHLAGAMGLPVWVALSNSADWRWLVGREDCPWYPTMRLFRQTAFKDWDSVFKRIAVEAQNVPDKKRSILQTDAAHLRYMLMQITGSISHPIFLKVGAHDGVTGDPCGKFFLENANWNGLLIEPVPHCSEKLRSIYSDRDRFKIDQLAVGNSPGATPFYFVSEDAERMIPSPPKWIDQLGSLDRNHIVKHLEGRLEPFIVEMDVEVTPLRDVLQRRGLTKVDFLHIDTEGHDLEVIKGVDLYAIAPLAVWVEYKHLSSEDRFVLRSLLEEAGYELWDAGEDFFAVHHEFDKMLSRGSQSWQAG